MEKTARWWPISKISTSPRPIRGKNEGLGGSRGPRVLCPVILWPVQTVKSICNQSNYNKISVELNSHADTCVVGSNVLVVHNHEHFVDVYGFDKETWHANACTIDATIVYKDPVTHLTVILMINHAIKINSMHNILFCPMQCCVQGTTVNECHKFLSVSSAKDNHALLVHDPNGCSPPLTIVLSLEGIPVTSGPNVPALQSMRTRI